MKNLFKNILNAPLSRLILLLALIRGATSIFNYNYEDWSSAGALLILLLFCSYDFMQYRSETSRKAADEILATLLLTLGAFIMLDAILQANWPEKNIAAALVLGAISTFSDGRKTFLALAPALTFGMVIIPLNEIITLAISYPLRLISAFLTSGILNLFTDTVFRDNTILYLGKQPVAITDSCSGVTQLGILLFLAYLLLRKNKSHRLLKLIWLLLLPLWILIANTIRLLLTASLFYLWGDKAFSSTPHVLLGFLFVIIATLLMWFSRKMLDSDPNNEE